MMKIGLLPWIVASLLAAAVPAVLAQPGGPPAGAGVPGVPLGAGYAAHDPNNPPQLPHRSDVLPWSVLSTVRTRIEKNHMLPVFPAPVQALNQKSQRIQGFMMPLDPGETQNHFLLSSVPLSCPFCMPGGPESMVEVKAKTPVRYSMDAVVVEGQFAVLHNDPNGLYYRMSNAVAVK